MKTLFLVTFLLFSLNLSSDELSWVDEQINAIKPPRDGVKSSTVSKLRDPFIFLHGKKYKKSYKKRRVYHSSDSKMLQSSTATSSSGSSDYISAPPSRSNMYLGAIMNNSALINGRWYKINDKVGGYTLTKVSRTSILLTYGKRSFILTTDSQNLNLKFNNK